MAPELLRAKDRPVAGTQRGDVYSFAIILHEMAYRKGVFYLADEPPPEGTPIHIVCAYRLFFAEILERVKRIPESEEDLCRPWIIDEHQQQQRQQSTVDAGDADGGVDEPILKQVVDQKYIDLMCNCWHEDPHERPDFNLIRKVVRSLNK